MSSPGMRPDPRGAACGWQHAADDLLGLCASFSDYALRVLMYAAVPGDRLITIEETAKTYNISRAHLMKVVNVLTRTGHIKGVCEEIAVLRLWVFRWCL